MNPEHLAVVKQGREAVHAWRKQHLYHVLNVDGANLRGADLRGADLGRADFSGADLSGAVLSGADLKTAAIRGAALRGADLSGASLCGADLSGADLSGADLRHTALKDADLVNANLNGADLRNAALNYVDFRDADLSRADLRGADLSDADIKGAKLMDADFTEADLGGTSFTLVDLSSVKGLESVRVNSPCSIGIDTLYLSKGQIPESFLVKCGVPDVLIDYLPSLLGAQQAIQFYSCFISYSTKDEQFCKRLHSRMRDAHLRVWFAPEDVKGGQKLHEQIDEAIRVYDKLLLVLSEASMQSAWVKAEIHRARQKEKGRKRVLFPIRLVSFEALESWQAPYGGQPKDMADEIREYYIPDFSNWKDHDAFEEAFQRLLRDLKASE